MCVDIYCHFHSSKKDQVLNSKDKAATCAIIADALVGAKTTDIQKLLSVGIETLLLLTADADPDVRMNANESLNRVIRVSMFYLEVHYYGNGFGMQVLSINIYILYANEFLNRVIRVSMFIWKSITNGFGMQVLTITTYGLDVQV